MPSVSTNNFEVLVPRKPSPPPKQVNYSSRFAGYEFKNGSNTECLPICDFCEGGNCTGPSNCTCWNNYEEREIVQGYTHFEFIFVAHSIISFVLKVKIVLKSAIPYVKTDA